MRERKNNFYLRPVNLKEKSPVHQIQGKTKVIYEIKGEIVNVVMIEDDLVDVRIREFYQRSGPSGVAYKQYPSKMNFTTLLNKNASSHE